MIIYDYLMQKIHQIKFCINKYFSFIENKVSYDFFVYDIATFTYLKRLGTLKKYIFWASIFFIKLTIFLIFLTNSLLIVLLV